MKSKKKMLLALGAMSVAAIGAGSVSTFAWYQANKLTGAVKTDTANTSALSVTDPRYSAATVDLPLKVILDKQTSASNLELSHYYGTGGLDGKKDPTGTSYTSSSTAGFYKAYYQTTTASSLVFSPTAETGCALYFDYKVGVYVEFPESASESPSTNAYWKDTSDSNKIKWRDSNGNDWEEDDVAEALVGVSVTYSLAYTDSVRTMFFGATLTPGTALVEGTGANTVSKLATGFTLAGTGSPAKISTSSASPEYIGRFGMYVEGSVGGDDAYEDYDKSAVDADFQITISKP